jgi:hypothetical protein
MLNPVGDFRPLEKIQLSAHISEPSSRYSTLTESVLHIIGDSREVAIYGYGALGYHFVYEQLKQEIIEGKSPLIGCYNFSDLYSPVQDGSGDSLHQKSPHLISYKAGILNVVLENCKRSKVGEPIIPVLFCVTSSLSERDFSPANANMRADPSMGNKRLCTAQELNLAYKLCFDPKLSKEVHSVALRTFIFVQTVGPISNQPIALKDTRLRIDDTWHRALKKVPRGAGFLRTLASCCCRRVKKQTSFKYDWRQWIIDSLARGNHSRFKFSVSSTQKYVSFPLLEIMKVIIENRSLLLIDLKKI